MFVVSYPEYIFLKTSTLKHYHLDDRRECELYLFVNSLNKNLWAVTETLSIGE